MASKTPNISDLVVAAYLEKNAPKTVVTGFKKSKGIKQDKLDEYDHLQAMLELATTENITEANIPVNPLPQPPTTPFAFQPEGLGQEFDKAYFATLDAFVHDF